MDSKRSDSVESLPEPLSERELEVLACLAEGLSNQEIANKLYLAVQTVRWYNSQIYSKLAVSNRHDALEKAQALGLLQKADHVPKVVGKHNLPTQATPFVGRQHELVELTQLLNDENTRLITILAPGGMGKTRLALEAARLQIGHYADGVIFVPLAPLSSPSDIVTTIAENIGFIFQGENPPAKQLIDFLCDRSTLLVLDNFEHLLDGTQLVADLIQIAPYVRLITTSRERLNLRGETVYILRGLEFPTWETPEDALQYDAVKLFMQSAKHVRADFTLQVHDLDYLARICRLTAGLPLGIELAAGWVDVLSLKQIAAEIQRGIDILETELRDVPERQRSIRATFNYTWDRLTDDEQTVFMRLSVFRGGFTIQGAQTVAGASVRSVKPLANKALVQVSLDGRHDIHELLRQFGVEKLLASGEQDAIQASHAAYFADFMADRWQDIRGSRTLKALRLIDPDFENVRLAWQYVVNQHQWDQLPKFLRSLGDYFDLRSRLREGTELFEQAVAALRFTSSYSENERTLGLMLSRLSHFYCSNGFWEKSTNTFPEAIRILRQHNSYEDLIIGLHARAVLAVFQRQTDLGLNHVEESLSIARSIGDKRLEGNSLTLLGEVSLVTGDLESVYQIAHQGFEIFEMLKDDFGIMCAYDTLGTITMLQEDYEQATLWFEKHMILAQTFGQSSHVARNYSYQGRIALARKDYSRARLMIVKALQIYCDTGYKQLLAYPLIYIAQIFAYQNQLERAVELRAAIDKYMFPSIEGDKTVQGLRERLETQMEPERFAAAWARGEKRALSEVVTELLAELVGD